MFVYEKSDCRTAEKEDKMKIVVVADTNKYSHN